MSAKQITINGCKILKNGVKGPDGRYSSAQYVVSKLIDGRNAVTIYAQSLINKLPKELGRVQNDTDGMSDYYETDKCRFYEGSAEFELLKPLADRW